MTAQLGHVAAAEGRPVLDGRLTLKLGADDTGEAYCLLHGHTPPERPHQTDLLQHVCERNDFQMEVRWHSQALEQLQHVVDQGRFRRSRRQICRRRIIPPWVRFA